MIQTILSVLFLSFAANAEFPAICKVRVSVHFKDGSTENLRATKKIFGKLKNQELSADQRHLEFLDTVVLSSKSKSVRSILSIDSNIYYDDKKIEIDRNGKKQEVVPIRNEFAIGFHDLISQPNRKRYIGSTSNRDHLILQTDHDSLQSWLQRWDSGVGSPDSWSALYYEALWNNEADISDPPLIDGQNFRIGSWYVDCSVERLP